MKCILVYLIITVIFVHYRNNLEFTALSECLPGLSGGVASWYVRTAVYNYCIDGSLAILCPSVTSY